MGSPSVGFVSDAKQAFRFRPWVRRAGLSIVIVAAAVTAFLATGALLVPSMRFGWSREPFVWVYIGTLWLGGLKVFVGTFRPVAEIDATRVVLRPLHQFFPKRIDWTSMLGTEQMMGGDRLIVYHQTARGMRFVALNLNLVKGRRDFVAALDERLLAMGFRERIVDRSRYLSRPA
jgi:hypothetical protein